MYPVLRVPLALGLALAGPHLLHAQAPEDKAAVTVFKDISYYTGKDADPERNKLDVYLPGGRKDFPVLFWVHGGGLRKGDRKNTQPLGEALAKHGIGFVTAGYRLSPAVRHPAHIEDVARAFDWTVRNVAKHGGRADAVFVGGYSAGGLLASLLATDEGYLKAHGRSFSDIRGVISVSGPQRLDYTEELADAFGGKQACADAAPLNHVGTRHPPFLIAFAEKDMEIVRGTSVELAELLAKRKIERTVVEVKDRDHGSINREMPKPGDPAGRAVVEFIGRHSKK